MTTADPIMKFKTFPLYVLTKRKIDNRFCDHIVNYHQTEYKGYSKSIRLPITSK